MLLKMPLIDLLVSLDCNFLSAPKAYHRFRFLHKIPAENQPEKEEKILFPVELRYNNEINIFTNKIYRGAFHRPL